MADESAKVSALPGKGDALHSSGPIGVHSAQSVHSDIMLKIIYHLNNNASNYIKEMPYNRYDSYANC